MNGRVYDPIIGRFLSPDPYIQAPYFAQNFDRYSYVWNNPLKYVDPSGYLMVPIYRDHGMSGIGVSRRQQNDELDWIYGRGLYAIDGPAVSGLVLQWLVTTGGGGGMPQVSWITTSSSGMVISGNSEYNGTYVAVTTHNGQTGSWVQVSGAITYGMINGKVVAVVNAGATCVWVASGVNNGYVGNDFYSGNSFMNGGCNQNDYSTLSNTGGGISLAMSTNEIGIGVASRFGEVAPGVLRYARYCKWLGVGGASVGVFVSVNNMWNDYSDSETINGWDAADAVVGSVGIGLSFILTGPPGWIVGAGTGLYFIGRAIYEEVNNP